jgi:pentatricopeptide repeat protein
VMILTILLNYTKTRYRRFFGRKGFFDDAFGVFDEMRLEKEREFEDIEKKDSAETTEYYNEIGKSEDVVCYTSE